MKTKPTANQVEHQPKPAQYISALTGLRAVAAYFVFLHHYNPAPPGTFANRCFAQGYIGVSVFFVLSGFLIYHRYADDYFDLKSWSWRRYLPNRFARIFPLYALLLFVTVGVNAWLGRVISWPLLVLNLTLAKGFFDDYKFSGIAQSWSLTVEACFYLLAPFLFVGIKRWGAFRLTIGLLSLGIVLQAVQGRLPFVLFYTFFGRAFEFVAGMWLARRGHQNKLPDVRQATGIGLCIMAGCVLWQANLPALTANPDRLFWSEILVYNYVLPVGISVFLGGLIRQPSIARQLLAQPILQMLGRNSYAFYLIHTGVVAHGFQKMGVTNSGLLFVLLMGMAHALYRFVEKPIHQQLRAS